MRTTPLTEAKIQRQSGLALIVCMWLLALLGMLTLSAFSSGQLESRQNHADLQHSKAMLAAEGSIALAIYDLLISGEQFPASGRDMTFQHHNVNLTLSVKSEHRKIDLNFGDLRYFFAYVHFTKMACAWRWRVLPAWKRCCVLPAMTARPKRPLG